MVKMFFVFCSAGTVLFIFYDRKWLLKKSIRLDEVIISFPSEMVSTDNASFLLMVMMVMALLNIMNIQGQDEGLCTNSGEPGGFCTECLLLLQRHYQFQIPVCC